jgi:uncharacterized protein YbjQ (UPF0145 family)
MRTRLLLIGLYLVSTQCLATEQNFMGTYTIDQIHGAEIIQQFSMVSIQKNGIGRQTDGHFRERADKVTSNCEDELIEDAKNSGANAIVGIRFTFNTSFESGWESYAMVCSGTPVLARKVKVK